MSDRARSLASRLAVVACVLSLAATRPAGAAPKPAASAPNSAAAKPAAPSPRDTMTVLGYVRRLASPSWEGRGIGTAGIDSAADWIARRMKQAGLAPAGDSGGWFQTFEVTTGVVPEPPCELEIGGATFPLGDALQPLGFSSNGSAHARVVFAGYGITAPGYQWDDYAGLDAHDAIVLVLTQEPGEMDSTSKFDGSFNTPFADVRTKAINAREHGALGLVVVNGPRWHAGEPPRAPARDGEGYMTSGLVAAWIDETAANALLKPAGTDLLHAQAAIESTGEPHSVALPDSATLTVNVQRARAMTRNVVGWFPGRDTARTLVLGAHYDHLGYGGPSSLAPNEHAPHVGADDNASGVAAILAAAQRLGAKQQRGWRPAHTIVVTAFTGEEMGLVGSDHFTNEPPKPIETVEAMVNLDMVGRLRKDQLQVMGVGTAAEFPTLVQNVNAKLPDARFDLKTSEDGYGPSDHQSFYKKNVPVLMLFTGAHADYHKPSDTWDKVHYAGLARVSDYAQALIESLDVRPRPTFTKAKSDASPGRIAGGGGYGAWLGTVPNYMQTEGGVLLDDVRDGSPAQKAGIRGGDVIVRFDGMRVDNIYDYTFGLRTRKPGQEVRITVKREGKEVDLVATLGRRP
ncbi:MAG TPA: M28 family peptidase [Verrucomicrobiae bacterium]|nr:M28 family peptidase [Verrucomicrobiae bacterium]